MEEEKKQHLIFIQGVDLQTYLGQKVKLHP